MSCCCCVGSSAPIVPAVGDYDGSEPTVHLVSGYAAVIVDLDTLVKYEIGWEDGYDVVTFTTADGKEEELRVNTYHGAVQTKTNIDECMRLRRKFLKEMVAAPVVKAIMMER